MVEGGIISIELYYTNLGFLMLFLESNPLKVGIPKV